MADQKVGQKEQLSVDEMVEQRAVKLVGLRVVLLAVCWVVLWVDLKVACLVDSKVDQSVD